MKRIVYLSFYFDPDLCAGSFRNSPLAIELASQAEPKNILIDIYTTLPNRYSTFDAKALEFEEIRNIRIHRILLPRHKSGMLDQVLSFGKYYFKVIELNKGKKASLVFASSSRLFTAFLGYIIAKKSKVPLYLDIRDIFVDTMNDVFKSNILKAIVMPLLKRIERKTFSYASHINLISIGFKDYFKKFNKPKFSFYSNGIDEEFLKIKNTEKNKYSIKSKKLIVYAGNIGDGQGLHKIIPQSAKLLGSNFQFLLIGDGGTKKILKQEIHKLGVNNIILKNPVNRKDLINFYKKADYLLIHLNNYPAFRKVLPSKIFELAVFNKPILAGVSGFSAQFIKNEIIHSFVFEPCDIKSLVNFLLKKEDSININRKKFINKFKRRKINDNMAKSILSYL